MSFWRIAVYDAEPGTGPLVLPPGPPRFVYVREGEARLGDGARLGADDGRFLPPGASVSGGSLWVFEAGPEAPFLDGPGVSLVLSRPLALDTVETRLLRADRVESQPGSVTPRHFHRGPGIRRVLRGSILGEIGQHWDRFDAGRAWFESGTDPVVGRNVHAGNSAFVRLLVLPIGLQGGQTSFVATDAAEAAKPRAVQNRIFAEVVLDDRGNGGAPGP
jgi:hypothetical protein